MIILTGASGFIGSCMLKKLNDEGYKDIIIVDNFKKNKEKNLLNKKFIKKIDRDSFFITFKKFNDIEFIIHVGAITNTFENNLDLLRKYNIEYSKKIWNICTKYNIPLIYISSAATYGDGKFGYSDNIEIINSLKPLNPYGDSKNIFDKWVIKQEKTPPFWYGLKFFNVFGPNEYHKNMMASVIYHSYNQIKNNNKIKLFKSYNNNYKDGEQLRDFIYVKDVIDIMYYIFKNKPISDIYNVGTGESRTFIDLSKSIFKSLNLNDNIEFIDMPIEIKDKYQYYTKADISKLRSIGYNKEFTSLENAINDYIQNYLIDNNVY